jgi:hypothetical protein
LFSISLMFLGEGSHFGLGSIHKELRFAHFSMLPFSLLI